MHKKTHCTQIGGKREETVKDDYGRQQSGLRRKLNENVCQKNGYLCPRGEAPNIIVKYDGGASKRVPSFLVEFVDILL